MVLGAQVASTFHEMCMHILATVGNQIFLKQLFTACDYDFFFIS